MNPVQLETAARHYCALSNLNADELLKLQKPIPGANGPIDLVPRWKPIANALHDQWRVNEALKEGLRDREQEAKTAELLRKLASLSSDKIDSK